MSSASLSMNLRRTISAGNEIRNPVEREVPSSLDFLDLATNPHTPKGTSVFLYQLKNYLCCQLEIGPESINNLKDRTQKALKSNQFGFADFFAFLVVEQFELKSKLELLETRVQELKNSKHSVSEHSSSTSTTDEKTENNGIPETRQSDSDESVDMAEITEEDIERLRFREIAIEMRQAAENNNPSNSTTSLSEGL